MVADILTVIQSRMSKFSKGQKLIAKYILSAYDKAAFMTASKLGGVVQVSESTVVRFAVGLGYDGYPEMQKALQEMILQPADLRAAHGSHQRPHRRPGCAVHGSAGGY